MSTALPDLLAALDRRVETMASACTGCGRCVEVCPMPGPAGVDAAQPRVAAGPAR